MATGRESGGLMATLMSVRLLTPVIRYVDLLFMLLGVDYAGKFTDFF